MLFGKRRKSPAADYDKAGKIPVIRSSICTGEQVADFKDAVSGKFEEDVYEETEKRNKHPFQRR